MGGEGGRRCTGRGWGRRCTWGWGGRVRRGRREEIHKQYEIGRRVGNRVKQGFESCQRLTESSEKNRTIFF